MTIYDTLETYAKYQERLLYQLCRRYDGNSWKSAPGTTEPFGI